MLSYNSALASCACVYLSPCVTRLSIFSLLTGCLPLRQCSVHWYRKCEKAVPVSSNSLSYWFVHLLVTALLLNAVCLRKSPFFLSSQCSTQPVDISSWPPFFTQWQKTWHTQTDIQTKYRNPRCACAPRVNKGWKPSLGIIWFPTSLGNSQMIQMCWTFYPPFHWDMGVSFTSLRFLSLRPYPRGSWNTPL